MIVRTRALEGMVAAVIALSMVGLAGARAEDAPGVLHSPFARGPVAGTLAVEDHRFWWGIDGVVPLGFLGGLRAPVEGVPKIGLGLSLAGSDTALVRDLGYTALLERRAPRAGEWLGISTGRNEPGAAPGARLHLGTGLWHAFKPFDVEAGLVTSLLTLSEQHAEHWSFTRDSSRWVDTTTYRTVDQPVVRTSAQTALRWQLGRVQVSAVGGVMLRNASAPQRWAQAAIDVRATHQLVVMAALGQRPVASLAFDPAAGPRTMLGLRFEPLASHDPTTARAPEPDVRRWTTRALPEGRTSVRVRCGDAMHVEVAGDFTDWTPVPLRALGSGWWGSEMVIAPGLHQVQVRVDGRAWQAPPGLPTTQGDFAGTAGVLLVE